ncbi:contact-dependent growth inhibition system immunity protein [Mycolicibacterium vaccae]|uniref:contact-dependent growth inhibition system immunity protein n=1 Tax=Mycolicibacterium vaccae TaxID=1810 RepID=UPI003D0239A8
MNDGSISTELHRFLAAYFHQDWDMEADGWEGIVDTYSSDHPSGHHLKTLAREIDDLRVARDEAALENFLVETIGVYYGPEPLTYKEWLAQIAERLRQHANVIDNAD